MAIVKLNRRNYMSRMHGRGIYGRYTQFPMYIHHGRHHHRFHTHHGYGIIDGLGKTASKYLLGGLGKSTGQFAGKRLAKLIQDKTGSELLGSVAKSGLKSLGGLAGEKLGTLGAKVLSDTVFNDEDKKKKKKEQPKVSLSQLLEQARHKIMPGSGINLID